MGGDRTVPKPTFRTSPGTNAAVRRAWHAVSAEVPSTVTIDEVIHAAVRVATRHWEEFRAELVE
jgi:hypothetical protein